ncbi:hypothetical protein QM012_005636 [Aureobasidium pullulans]|uniref:Uncharacterized protein n=1 Tax=Aureobasidium pullulans TaxID=5580 RepID=A0ABR0TQA0_AURPU
MSSSTERSCEDLLQDNKRLKKKLQECREENRGLAQDYNGLHDEFNEAVDLYNKAREKIKKLREKNIGLQDEVEDLENEQKQQEAKIKEKTQKIRHMVKERNDLQERLARKAQETDGVGATLNFEQKQNIAASTRLDKQLGDETFRKAFDQIYERFRECFLVVRRRQQFDIKTALSDKSWEKWLSKRVPGWKDNTFDDRLHVCIALVSKAFIQFVNDQFVFGLPNKDPIQAAWWAWLTLAQGPQTSRSEKDVKQWLALTSTVLTNNHRDLMVQAREDSLDMLLNNMKANLETATTLEFTDAIRRRLSDAISPHLTTLRMLHYQEWNYKLNMVTASREGAPVRFSRARMEGMFGEETGFVQGSLFPQLCRLEENDEDEDESYTVICKARVVVVATWGDEPMKDVDEDSGDSDEEEMIVAEGLDSKDANSILVEDEEEAEAEGEKKQNVIADSFDKAQDEMDEGA